METLLTQDQKEIFARFNRKEPNTPEDAQILAAKESDKDFDLFHERSQSNFVRLISLSDTEATILKDFLERPMTDIVDRFEYRSELRYSRIFSISDALSIDWVYFPKTSMRREMLKIFHDILGCDLNFVIC